MSAIAEKSNPRGGAREARRAARSAPLPDNLRPVRPGMNGGNYKPLSDAHVLKIHNAALDALEHIGLADAPESGMGNGIGQWALYRAQDGSLCLFSLVVPPGQSTPIHDHRAWGLIGLYRGTQDEDVYAHGDDHERVHLKSSNKIEPGEFFALIPPDDDIHQITTTSDVTSVSLHLLTNDTGCIWRHKFDQETGLPSPFRSGYVNAECDDEHDHQHDHAHSHTH